MSLVALAAVVSPGPALASRADPSWLNTYVRARAADSLGAADIAVANYGVALHASPDNQIIAMRALRQALAAGDRPLAVKAARILEKAEQVAPDVHFLLLVEAVRLADWHAADLQITALERNEIFSFMAPVLRAWVMVGAGKGDPLAVLASSGSDPLAASYIAEHRVLLLFAAGREQEGLDELRKLRSARDGRALKVRIAAASYYARRGKRDEALQLLAGNGTVLAAARSLVERRKPLPGEIASPPAGVAEFLMRIALDLRQQDVNPLALSFARLATFVSPGEAEAWVITSELLAGAGQQDAALAALRNVPPADPLAATAADLAIRLMAVSGDPARALAEAEAATKSKKAGADDWARLGDLYGEQDRHGAAADAYGRALTAAKAVPSEKPLWALWLLRGAALEQANRWEEAKMALEAAYRLAPDQPLVLNYLGYAQLERRENIVAAEKLVSEAHRLRPESAEITDSLGWARYLQGDTKRAIELLERAVQNEPADPAINEHLGDAYFSAGRRFEARYAWTAALIAAEQKDADRLRAKIDAGLLPHLTSP